ncbi:cytochrome P450/oxidoreductase [Phycicoccus sp. CSK15P-2]|uniref:cytochrome P450 n=1 Tax=Phycicoccus sp. CSK15P-2 TaxID=2807627 RepID=UPI0019523FB5|nr:cytochrome P450 [Phycicoccus sp. CSK15P-2]MBM6406031.1 cytochrome P450/oxidoreductase [Phycicoccus sp. CSK15P-2]
MTVAATPREYDPFSDEFKADPFPVYDWMREEAPVYHSEKWGWWALSRFDDVRAAATDPETFLSFEGIDIDDTAKDQSGPGFLPDIDNPRHDALRQVIQPFFLPRRIAEREDAIRAVIRGHLAPWRDRGRVDLAQEFAWPIPNDVFFAVLGLPGRHDDPATRAQLDTWVHQLKDRKPGDQRLTPVARAATEGIRDYFVHLLDDRRAHPRDDVLTHLVRTDIGGVPFAEEHITPASEVLGLMMVLFLGGVESTAGLIGTTFRLLADHPDQRELVLRDPSLIPSAVDEAVRWNTPLQLVGRTAARDVTLHGTTIPEGGRVVLVYGAANRDERRFEDADRYLVTRGRFRHLGFGEGMHGCLGRPLALLETQVALEEALPVLGRYALDGEPEKYRSTPNMHVWWHLPVSFTPPGERGESGDAVSRLTGETMTEAVVEAKDAVADGVVSLTLRPTSGGPFPAWRPGAHVDLVLPGVRTRQYSLCGDPDDCSTYRLGVLREPASRGTSELVHAGLRAGDTVRVVGPRNHFRLAESDEYVFVAGGIGITPILPMLREAQARGADWHLTYGGRSRASMAFLDELERYGDRVTVAPQDETGLLDLAAALGEPREATAVYCCGPGPLLDAVEAATAGWPRGSLHVERFAAKPLTDPVRADAFEVELRASGRTVTVPPDVSVLDAVAEAGVPTVSSCAEGTCGTCETTVLEGTPDHRDSVLDETEREAGDCMMICVSRSCTSRLVRHLSARGGLCL